MRYCKKCGDEIPWRTTIDDKLILLTRRSNCLTCVPFGSKINKSVNSKAICSVCHKQYNQYRGRTKCGACQSNMRRFKLKKFAVEYKGGKCQKCGYSKCLQALTFHHREPKDKKFQISGSHCRSRAKVIAELDKCDLLCYNCHAELHAGFTFP